MAAVKWHSFRLSMLWPEFRKYRLKVKSKTHNHWRDFQVVSSDWAQYREDIVTDEGGDRKIHVET